MLLLVAILKAINQVALYALIGQGILYVFAGSRREQNFVHTVLKSITTPAMKITRTITPRFIADQHFVLIVAKLHLFTQAAGTAP